VVSTLREVYAMNADRHDPLVGDDSHTFATNVWRNSWAQIEATLRDDPDWTCSRPNGSFMITGEGLEIHIYKCGQDEAVDVDAYRLDDADTSTTKQRIAQTNQLTLDLWHDQQGRPGAAPDLTQLVFLHAGNMTEGCCAAWIGAPVLPERDTDSPWTGLRLAWLIDRDLADADTAAGTTSHTDLAEPPVEVDLRIEPAPAKAVEAPDIQVEVLRHPLEETGSDEQ
jgi:hypothetical protein